MMSSKGEYSVTDVLDPDEVDDTTLQSRPAAHRMRTRKTTVDVKWWITTTLLLAIFCTTTYLCLHLPTAPTMSLPSADSSSSLSSGAEVDLVGQLRAEVDRLAEATTTANTALTLAAAAPPSAKGGTNGRLEDADKTPEQMACLNAVPTPTIYDLGMAIDVDKVNRHTYDVMYDFWLAPYRCRKVKLLEIGLGCNMHYGPGKSYHLWLKYFPFIELHFLEYNAGCVEARKADMSRATMHTGDQKDLAVLKKVLRDSGGEFDIIIDDGEHSWDEQHIATEWLYVNGVKPGGLFIMEDLFTSDKEMGDDARSWYLPHTHYASKTRPTTIETYTNIQRQLMSEWQVPADPWVAWTKQMSCGVGMCVFQKWNQWDFDHHRLGGADLLRKKRTPPTQPTSADWN